MAKNSDAEHTSINLIGNGTTIKGEVKSNGDIRIDGTLIGQVYSKGKIVVGNTGIIEGEIYCQNADFSGNIKAKVEVSELLTLKATSRLRGEIVTNKLAIEPGARFTGTCTMDKDSAEDLKTPLRPEQPKK
ncbi:MAG: polymer-forming cytoskeletal protein [Bacteroidetes bacterium]|nr:MAG: polymer-forming cytoskeletal protein [Bacteroidota bacterium]